MKTIRKQILFQQWKTLLVLALLVLVTLPAMALNRSIVIGQSGGGTFRYRYAVGGTYNDWSSYVSSKTLSVPDGATLQIQVQPNTDKYFVKYTATGSEYDLDDNYYYYFSYGVRQDLNITCNFTSSYKTIKGVSETNSGGTAYGTIKVSGPFAPQTIPTAGIKVGVGAQCILSAVGNEGYGLYAWKLTNTDGDIQTYFPDFRFTVSANRTYFADFASVWEGDLIGGATYTITSPNSDNNHFKVTCSNTSSPHHNKTYAYIGALNVPESKSVTITLNNAKPMLQKKTITVQKSGTLTIKPTGANRTIQRHWFNGSMIKAITEGSKVVVGDGGSYYVILYSGANFKNKTNTSEWDARGWNRPDGSGQLMSDQRGIGVILQTACNLTLNKVYLRGAYNDGSNPRLNGSNDTPGYKIAGAILANSSAWDTKFTMTMTDVTIEGCYAPAGAAIYFQSEDYHKATMTRVTIRGCYTDGDENSEGIDYGNGIIRTNGGVRTDCTMNNCTVTKNRTENAGGAITWNAGGQASTKLTLNNCMVTYNEGVNGGGINTSGEVVFSNTEVCYNTTHLSGVTGGGGHGGGVYISTYGNANATGTGADGHSGKAVAIQIGSGTKIHHNTALGHGGGIFYRIARSNDIGFNEEGNPIDVNFSVVINGGEVYNNTADLGGAVCIVDDAARKHRNFRQNLNNGASNPAYGKWSGVYNREFKITSGKLYNNWITDNSTNVRYGGGIYIQKGKNAAVADGSAGYNYTNSNLGSPSAGTMNVTLSGGEVYNNTNNYGNGGGLAIQNYEYTGDALPAGYVSESYTTVSGGFSIYNNTCKKSPNSTNNDNGNGGGIFINGGNFTMTNGIVGKSGYPNKTVGGNGGSVYVRNGNILIKGGSLSYNQATKMTSGSSTYGGNGGGFYITNGTVEIQGGTISNNSAEVNGGGFYVIVSDDTKITKINSNAATTTISNNTATNGAGAYINRGKLQIESAATNITSNTATTNGGGIYMVNGTVTFANAKLQSNMATNSNGGGLYLGNGTITISGANSAIQANQAKNNGGGVYIGGGTFSMTGGTIGGTTAQGNKATGELGAGGGIYMAGGTATVSGGAISGNTATKDGGGVYMYGTTASCTLTNNATIGGASATYGNTARYGGGIYSAGGVITVKGGHISYNSATLDGGGIYSSGPNSVVNVEKQTSKAETLSYIERNTATNGGGIYCNIGTVNFSDGYIQYNHATEAGGGIYVNDNGGTEYGKLFLKGSANLYRNHVPTGQKGGGVYLKGVITVGEEVSDPSLLGVIKAEENFAFTTDTPESHTITDETRNNVYLPAPAVDNTYHKDVITVIYNGIDSENTKVGFSVPGNYVPVIYCADNGETCTEPGYEGYTTSQHFLHQFSTGMELQDNLFDDSDHYIAVHYVGKEPIFDPNHVYLYGFWTNIVTEDPTGGHYEEHLDDIDTPEKLAYFISYVNGINDCAGHPHPDAVGNITADIDMSLYGWVPIGELSDGFSGTLNGNGHTITGVSSLLYGDHMAYGIVGKLDGGTVKDLFVKDAVYALEYKDGLIIGGLVGDMTGGGTVENSEVSASIIASHPNTIVGGLVGRMGHSSAASPCLHSCIGIADMTGYLMGGLVGRLEKGDLLNSFANARFTSSSDSHYQGGLAAVNRGRIENCYFREQADSAHGALFGALAGDNTGGTVSYSYAAATPYTATADVAGTLTGHGLYADNTVTPYYYHRRDNQVTLASSANPYRPVALPGQNPQTSGDIDEQMLHYLNNWVDTANKHQSEVNYSRWSRPTTKVINDDLPLLLLPSGNAVAATTGDPYLEYGSANTRIANFRSLLQAVYMYRAQTDSVRGNADSDAELYIDEHVALVQSGDLNAHVGVSLDNSAGSNGAQPTYGGVVGGTQSTDYTDWHMFATPLAEVPLGIDYGGDETQWHGAMSGYAYYDHAGMPYYRFLPAEQEGGYFPSMTYQYATANGFVYDGDNTSATAAGNYYDEWDFYCYYEPEYHWINFKRNGNDHWHENAPDFHIDYKPNGVDIMNEEYLVPGKGYLVATREHNTFLQAKGVLNSDEVTVPVTRLGYFSTGYNLLGNPYQAYLDFERFAAANAALWNGDTPSYYILDEDSKDYVAYVSQGSTNPARPEQFIHPHQGFMILLNSGEGGTATFQPSMRNVDATAGYRDARPAYPLVNLFATEQNGNRTMVTVELGRPDKGGAAALKDMHVSRGKLYCRYEGEDYEIAFTRPGLTEAAIRFETLEDAEYTMTWGTHNGEFGYLHLIDNLTGADVDCLAESEYRFTSRTGDYKSRFRLVFGYTGIEEPEGSDDVQTQFAFMSGGQLVVNGEGTLQVFDVSGRQVMSTETHGTQTTVGLPGLAAGVYTLRMTTQGNTQVQKIVIR